MVKGYKNQKTAAKSIVNKLIKSIDSSIVKFGINANLINIFQIGEKSSIDVINIKLNREFDDYISDEVKMDFWHSMLVGIEDLENWNSDSIGNFVIRIDEIHIVRHGSNDDPRVIISGDEQHLLFLPDSKRIAVVKRVQEEVKPKSYKRLKFLKQEVLKETKNVVKIQENIDLENIQKLTITVLS